LHVATQTCSRLARGSARHRASCLTVARGSARHCASCLTVALGSVCHCASTHKLARGPVSQYSTPMLTANGVVAQAVWFYCCTCCLVAPAAWITLQVAHLQHGCNISLCCRWCWRSECICVPCRYEFRPALPTAIAGYRATLETAWFWASGGALLSSAGLALGF